MTDESKTVVKEIFEHAWSDGDLEALDRVLSDNFHYLSHSVAEPISSASSYKDLISAYRKAFPDLTISAEEVVAEDNTVVMRWMLRGTHEGDLPQLPATGKQVEVGGVSFLKLEWGKVTEERANWDLLTLINQLHN